MPKWAILTVFAYVILVAVLFIPAVVEFACYLGETFSIFSTHYYYHPLVFWLSFYDSLEFWQLCLYLSAVLFIQALLLFYPVKASKEKLIPKKITWVQILVTALMMSVLIVGLLWSLTMGIGGDNFLGKHYFVVSIPILITWWIVWSCVFYRFSKNTESKDFFQRTISWVIRGSILELLIAIPSHMIVRRRNQCCAPGFTAAGIAAGLIIMLLAFGPSLYFLFQKRFERIKPRSKKNTEKSELGLLDCLNCTVNTDISSPEPPDKPG